ncbi:MAG: hypothetical protein O2780_09095 [Proteobacteria bacterium]|nr:hypothetical protein [Pseudomonadota bacterium]
MLYAIGPNSINRRTLAITYPVTSRLTPELEVTVHLHEFYLGDRERSCWTYVTNGLSALAAGPKGQTQQEMSLSLLLEDDDVADDFPRAPLKLFQFLAEHVRQGRIMTAGRATTLGQSGLFGFDALFYLPAVSYDGIADLDNHLALMLVHRGEYEFARRYGLSRMVSRISRMCSCFPFPTWNTRRRPSLFEPHYEENSVIDESARTGLDLAIVRRDHITLALADNGRDALASLLGLGEGHGVVLLADPVNVAEAALYWTPLTRGAVTLIPSPTDFSVSFVRVTLGNQRCVQFIEDGIDLTILAEDLIRMTAADGVAYQAPLVQVIRSGSAHPATPYQPGAGWLVPALLRQRWFDRVRGNLVLRRVEVTDDGSWDGPLALVDAVHAALAEAMSEEAESFQLRLTLHGDVVQPSASISLNPRFVQYVSARLERLDKRGIVDRAPVTLFIDVNP